MPWGPGGLLQAGEGRSRQGEAVELAWAVPGSCFPWHGGSAGPEPSTLLVEEQRLNPAPGYNAAGRAAGLGGGHSPRLLSELRLQKQCWFSSAEASREDQAA